MSKAKAVAKLVERPVRFTLLDPRLPHLEPEQLRELFATLNRQLFGGRLPTYRVQFGPSGKSPAETGYCDESTRTIFVNPDPPTPEGLRRILLHEICHIGSLGHGARFQRKLRRLAVLGEAWATDEANDYAAACAMGISPTAEIARALKDMALDQPGEEWESALRELAFRVGRFEREIERIAPWAERLWRRIAAEHRASKARPKKPGA